MKNLFLTVLMSFISLSIMGEEKVEKQTIMLHILSDIKLPPDFRVGVEEGLTKSKYILIDESIQTEVISEQTDSTEGCIEDSCIVNTGKMLAAVGVVVVDILKKNDRSYLFKIKYIDMETGTTQLSINEYFEYDIKNDKELYIFGKNLGLKVSGIEVNRYDFIRKYVQFSVSLSNQYLKFDYVTDFSAVQPFVGVEASILELTFKGINIFLLKGGAFLGQKSYLGYFFGVGDIYYNLFGVKLGITLFEYLNLENDDNHINTFTSINLGYLFEFQPFNVELFTSLKIGTKSRGDKNDSGFIFVSGLKFGAGF